MTADFIPSTKYLFDSMDRSQNTWLLDYAILVVNQIDLEFSVSRQAHAPTFSGLNIVAAINTLSLNIGFNLLSHASIGAFVMGFRFTRVLQVCVRYVTAEGDADL